MVFAVAHDVQPVNRFRDRRRNLRCILRRRGIMQSLHPAPVVVAPGRSLVGKNVRIVIVEDIDHVGIAERLKKKHVFVVIPIRTRRDDGVLRSVLPDRRGQLRFHAIPAVTIMKLRLVENLEKNAVGIIRGVMASNHAPKISKALDRIILFREPGLKV